MNLPVLITLHVVACIAIVMHGVLTINHMHRSAWLDFALALVLSVSALGLGLSPFYGYAIEPLEAFFSIAVALWVWCFQRSAFPFVSRGKNANH